MEHFEYIFELFLTYPNLRYSRGDSLGIIQLFYPSDDALCDNITVQIVRMDGHIV